LPRTEFDAFILHANSFRKRIKFDLFQETKQIVVSQAQAAFFFEAEEPNKTLTFF